MDSYIIRIYRQEKDAPRAVVGTAERVGDEDKKAFKSLDELWHILNTGQPKIVAPARREKRKRDER